MRRTSRILFSLFVVASFFAVAAGRKPVRPPLIYSHKLHVDSAETECAVCHEPADTSTLSGHNLLPTADICIQCHDDKEKECQHCHGKPMDEDMPHHHRMEGSTTGGKYREIVFGHKKHVERSDSCVTCHIPIPEKEDSEEEALPEMAQCMSCHDQAGASNHCGVCHSDPSLAFSHESNWGKKHGNEVDMNIHSCDICHPQSACDQCHQGLVFEEVHRINFRYTHAMDAFGADDKCVMCHQRQQFCDDCHAKAWGMIARHGTIINNSTSCRQCHE